MNRITLSFVLILLFSLSCVTVPKHAAPLQIHEISTMSELKSWIIPDTVVMFDLDNTVFESKSIVGHANWYHDQIKKHPDEHDRVLKRAWKAIMNSEVEPVERLTVDLIRDLQNQGIAVMGFTARNMILVDTTMRQIKSVGVDFSRTSLAPDSKYVHGGVLFAHNKVSKGQALSAFLNKIPFKPKRVILVDDVRANLESVCEATGAIGLYYPLVDKKRPTAWDEKESDRQWLLEE